MLRRSLLLLLFGCGGDKDREVDLDGDGYGGSADCDDESAAIHPGAEEICDGLDDDCDGLVDEDPVDGLAFYADADGDGHGDGSSPTLACEAASGQVESDDDCDDGDPARNPDASETCNAGIDDDCDGLADDADPGVDASTASTWYADADGDGYGDAAAATAACDAPAGTVADASDCDDGDAAVNPAAVEIRDAADTDEDCNGLADDGDPGVDPGGTSTWYADADGDGYGDPDASTAACDAASGQVANSQDCDDGDGAVNPGEAESCDNGIDDDCDEVVDCSITGTSDLGDPGVYTVEIVGEASNDGFGRHVSGGDVNGDGLADLLTGAYLNDFALTDGGSAYLYLGPLSVGSWSATDHLEARLYGYDSTSNLADEVYVLPDIDGDGYDDVYLSRTRFSGGYLHHGPLSGSIDNDAAADLYMSGGCDQPAPAGEFSATHAGDEWVCGYWYNTSQRGRVRVYNDMTEVAEYRGVNYGDQAGWDVAGGPGSDVDGDGVDDIWISAIQEATGGTNAGKIYLVLGPGSGTQSLSAADNATIGSAGDLLGYHLLAAGDLDGDGVPELWAGAPYNDGAGADAGAVYLFADPAADTSTADAVTVVHGGTSGDMLGRQEIAAGDVDGDGESDLLLCSAQRGSSAGAAWLFYGPVPSGTLDVSTDADAALEGPFPGDGAGSGCAVLGDTDGDGFDDLAIGATAGDGGGMVDYGAVWILLGR